MLSTDSNRLEQSPLGLCGSLVLQITWNTLINASRALGKGAAGVTARGASKDETARGAKGAGLRPHTPDGFGTQKHCIDRLTKVITKHDHEPAADDTQTPLRATSGTTAISSENSTNIYTDIGKNSGQLSHTFKCFRSTVEYSVTHFLVVL